MSLVLPSITPKKSRNMSRIFLGGIFFLRYSEEVSVDLFTFTVCGMAEKDEDVIAPGEFSGVNRQRSERPIFSEADFAGPASEDFSPFDGLEDYLVVRVIGAVQFHQQTRFPSQERDCRQRQGFLAAYWRGRQQKIKNRWRRGLRPPAQLFKLRLQLLVALAQVSYLFF